MLVSLFVAAQGVPVAGIWCWGFGCFRVIVSLSDEGWAVQVKVACEVSDALPLYTS